MTTRTAPRGTRRLAWAVAALMLLAAAPAAAATLSVTTAHLGVANPSPPVFFGTSLSLPNKSTILGRAQPSDQVVVVYSAQAQQSTLCSGWSNSNGTETLSSVTVTINDGAAANGDDTFTVTSVPATCSGGFKFGTIDLGAAGYVTGGSATFTSSTIGLSQTASSTTITITLGTAGGTGTRATLSSGNAATYTPTSSITDTAGHAIGTNTTVSTTTVQF